MDWSNLVNYYTENAGSLVSHLSAAGFILVGVITKLKANKAILMNIIRDKGINHIEGMVSDLRQVMEQQILESNKTNKMLMATIMTSNLNPAQKMEILAMFMDDPDSENLVDDIIQRLNDAVEEVANEEEKNNVEATIANIIETKVG